MKFVKKTDGFTLVELIVVIAILAILAAIAVPAYSGYIQKANEAGDQQLLAAVNTAFAAACLENNEDMMTISSYPSIPLTGTKGAMTIDFTNVRPYGKEFQNYFGNDNAVFKSFEGLYFNKATGVFEADAPVAFTYAGSPIYANKATIELMKNSGFMVDGLGAEGLMDKVDLAAKGAKEILGDTPEEIEDNLYEFVNKMGGDALVTSLADRMGLDLKELGLEGATGNTLTAGVYTALGDTMSPEEIANALANNTVLFVADNASDKSTTDVMAMLKSETLVEDIRSLNSADKLTDATLLYGMYTAYAYSTGNDELIASTTNAMDILKVLGDDTKMAGFQNYLDDPQATTDLEAYMAALNTVNSAADDKNAAQQVVLNGFGEDNKELTDLLASIMGQQ